MIQNGHRKDAMKTDWNKIKTTYVEGPEITQQALAVKFKVNYDVLRRHASKERWQELRKLFVQRVSVARQEKKTEILASEGAQFASDSLKLARAGYVLVAEAISERKPANQIAQALRGFQEVGLKALGEKNDMTERSPITITVVTEEARALTEELIKGEWT